MMFVATMSFIPAFAQIQDKDNDGIPDSTDKCPSINEDYLGDSRFDGCPDTKPAKSQDQVLIEPLSVEENVPVSDTMPREPIQNIDSDVGFKQEHDVEYRSDDTVTESNNIKILDLSKITSVDYFDNLIRDITEQASFYDLIIFSISMVIYAIFIFHFYRFIARRSIFSFDVERRILGGKYKASGEKISAAPRVAAFIGTKFVIFPFVIFGWFVAYSFFILLMSQDIQPEKIFFISAILIIAIRITSYYSEDLSKDLAKTIPFSILGIFLFDQTFFTMDDVQENLLQLPEFAIHIGAFLVLAITAEIVLSTAYLIKLKISGKRQKKKDKSGSDQPINNSQSS